MRPDELAAMAPSQKESSLASIGKAGLGLAGAGAGAAFAARITPFLSEYIPVDLALKGISKISPELGKFLQKGVKSGLDPKEGIKFVKDNILKQPQQAPGQTNIIRQYSDKLDAFLNEEIQKGRTPLQAGALARSQKEFDAIIKKMEKDHKTNWSDILSSVYGSTQQPQTQKSIPTGRTAEQAMYSASQAQPTQMTQPQQQGGQNPNDVALMAALQKILAM